MVEFFAEVKFPLHNKICVCSECLKSHIFLLKICNTRLQGDKEKALNIDVGMLNDRDKVIIPKAQVRGKEIRGKK